MLISVVHDLAEAQATESPRKKNRDRNRKPYTHLHNSSAAQQIEALWKEYEDRETPEARYVKGASGISCISAPF
ncbi:hypothetical protein DFJ43DRAFT_711577 [Lentinula guzmanii]|uniref:HD domain-containing protein n=1 Tax=Lentinula guzmanii TaxID=2804957 RepID=A0AA38J5N1_9AGAR|nr:hypothetical protein DFJ43DRAFT_711577 [Lentinula guzmanii]